MKLLYTICKIFFHNEGIHIARVGRVNGNYYSSLLHRYCYYDGSKDDSLALLQAWSLPREVMEGDIKTVLSCWRISHVNDTSKGLLVIRCFWHIPSSIDAASWLMG